MPHISTKKKQYFSQCPIKAWALEAAALNLELGAPRRQKVTTEEQ